MRQKIKRNLPLARIARTWFATGLLLAGTVIGYVFGARQGFGQEPTVTLEFSTFVGSTNCTSATLREATVDSAGNIVAVGRGVFNPNGWPAGVPVHTYGPLGGGRDIILIKLKHDGSQMLWVALLGGTKGETGGYGVCVDGNDDIYITGKTESADFPTTTGAFDATYAGGKLDAFLCKLPSDGNRLIYSTFLGSSQQDSPRGGIAIDSAGHAYVAMSVQGADFLQNASSANPANRTNAFTPDANGYDHAIVKVSQDGSRVEYCHFMGPLGMNLVRIELDGQGRIYLNDYVDEPNMYVTPGAAQPTYGGGTVDGAFHVFSNDMQTCYYSSFLGGNGNEYSEHRIAVDPGGTSTLCGYTDSTDLPVVNAHQPLCGGAGDAYLAKFDPSGAPVFVTYIGGSRGELSNGPAMDANGNVFVTGLTGSSDFEVTPGAYDSSYAGGRDMFLQIYSPTGQLLYSTVAGETKDDQGRFITLDGAGNAIIVGRTLSREFPTTAGAHDRSFAGKEDLFCMKFKVSRAPTRPRRSNR